MPMVLHVITSTQVGGAENHVLALTQGLQKEGWNCAVAYLKGRGDLDTQYAAAGISVHPLGLEHWWDVGAAGRLVGLIRREQAEIIHAHLFPAEVFATVASLAAGSRAKLVCTKHNDEDFLRRWHFRFLHRLISHRAAQTIIISEHLRRFTTAIGTADPSRLVTIPYGYDRVPGGATGEGWRQKLGLGQGTFVIGAVGRLVPQKGHRYLIEAVRRMASAGEDVALAIVGEGPLLGRLEEQVAAAELGRRVFFIGFRRDIPDLLAAFDVFVLPSLWEGFGLVLLEAMAARRAIVASRVSAIPEVVEDGVSGVLVPPADPKALAEALLALRHDAARRAALGAAGHERLRREFTLERLIERTIEVYRSVLQTA